MICLILIGALAGDAAGMVRKALTVGVLLLALAPAAHLAWVAREMPHFGHLHDDSIYFVCAKSLAQGNGYRILSLPAEPFQTKYPPIWPLALAAIWKLDPRFPENLRWGMALGWIMLPAFVALAWWWYRRRGFDVRLSTALCALIALSPCAIVLSAGLMSDLVFSVALLAAILAIERAGQGTLRSLGAGALAALAYLIKTAALPLALAGPLWLALRRKYRAAALMFAAMCPAIVAWTLWSRAHMSQARDLVTLYYTNYLGYQIFNVGWRDLPLVMWKNLDGVFSGIAELLIFDVAKTPWGMYLARFLGVVVIAGTVRLALRSGTTPYHWFALAYIAILVVWHFPPNSRFLLPLFPLLLAGLATELANLTRVIRNEWPRGPAQKVVVAAISAGSACILYIAVAWNVRALSHEFPQMVSQHRAIQASNRRAFAWIAQHVPAGSFYAYDDAVFYLYTGHHAASLPVAPLPFYREDHESIIRPFRGMPAFAREQRLDYVLFTAADFHRDLPDAERAEVRQILANEHRIELIYKLDLSAIFHLASRGAVVNRKAADAQTLIFENGNTTTVQVLAQTKQAAQQERDLLARPCHGTVSQQDERRFFLVPQRKKRGKVRIRRDHNPLLGGGLSVGSPDH